MFVLLLILHLGSSAIAADAPDDDYEPGIAVEIGAAVGTPSLMNAIVGAWWGKVPLVTRISFGVGNFDASDYGYQGEIGYPILRMRHIKSAITLVALKFAYPFSHHETFSGLGPAISFNLAGFFLQLGAARGWDSGYTSSIPSQSVPAGQTWLFLIQVGYARIFEKS